MASTREALARFFNISSSGRISFTFNATQGINTALFGALEPGHCVVTTGMEHNAVARPLYYLEQQGIKVIKVAPDQHGCMDSQAVLAACGDANPSMVVMNHCSNVTGSIQPIEEIAAWCRAHGKIFMLDAAQSAGVLPIDVAKMNLDILVAPGHKSLFGPQGTGFMYVREGIELKPFILGGTGNLSSELEQPAQMPERFESGTLNTAALTGLNAGLEFVESVGMESIRAHEQMLAELLWNELKDIKQLVLYGPGPGPGHSGPISFTLNGRDSAEIGFLLDHQFEIAVRTGLHCAPDAHRSIGTFPGGTVRVSPGYFNTREHILTFIQAVKSIAA
jgi:cysteine desulfurase family protein